MITVILCFVKNAEMLQGATEIGASVWGHFYQYALMANLLSIFWNGHSYKLYIWGVGGLGLCHVLACQRQITPKGSVALAT